jgi:hypothetical protein
MSKSAPLQLDISGHCDCGAVTVLVKGAALSMFQCGCRNCQTVSGGGHASVVLMPAEAVRVDGDVKSFDRPADSGATFTRHFCPSCGTTTHARSSRAPGVSILPVGIFAGANDWFAPNQLIFARQHPAWDSIDEHLPRHDAYRPEHTR